MRRYPRHALVLCTLAAGLGPVLFAPPSSAAPPSTTASRLTTASASVQAASSYRPTAADRRIASKLNTRATTAAFGRYFSGTVLDVASNRVVWNRAGGTGRMPASTAKLVTATNALTVFGPTHRFRTTVYRGSAWSTVVLVGAGDPSLSTANLNTLAKATAVRLRAQRQTWARVKVDDHIFPKPTLASGWKASYVPADVRAVRALVVDGHHAKDTSLDAGAVFAARLRAAGIKVTSVGRATAPTGSPLLAGVSGQRVDAIVRQMMLVSDNDHAEALHRLVARATRYPTSWAGAHRAQQATMARDGVWLPSSALKDGSGLSRGDRISTTALARVVDNILEPGQSDLAVLRSGGLPLSGRTGTLKAAYGRFTTAPSKCAAGRIVGKTGTLTDAAALAGWTRGSDGRLKAFAFVVNYRKANLAQKRQIDALAATVTGCY